MAPLRKDNLLDCNTVPVLTEKGWRPARQR